MHWRNKKRGNLTMDLKACFSGYISQQLNISQALISTNGGLTIYAAASFWLASGTILIMQGITNFIMNQKLIRL